MKSFPTHLFTSESVTEGHPDKVTDVISDAVLDALLQKNDSMAALSPLEPTRLIEPTMQ